MRATPNPSDPHFGPVWTLLQTRFAGARRDAVVQRDEARLRDVLRQRRDNAETHDGTLGGVRQLVPGRSWTAWARGLGLLLPPVTVADLGCGEGYLTLEVAAWAGRVIAVDRSARVLDRARTLAASRQVTNVEWRRGEIEQLPLDTGAADVALLSQALHHAGDPGKALQEAARVVAENGRVLILDLLAHGEAWTRERFGDRWPGFRVDELTEMMTAVGLVDVRVRPATDGRDGRNEAPHPGDVRGTSGPFGVLAAIGTKPKSEGRTRR